MERFQLNPDPNAPIHPSPPSSIILGLVPSIQRPDCKADDPQMTAPDLDPRNKSTTVRGRWVEKFQLNPDPNSPFPAQPSSTVILGLVPRIQRPDCNEDEPQMNAPALDPRDKPGDDGWRGFGSIQTNAPIDPSPPSSVILGLVPRIQRPDCNEDGPQMTAPALDPRDKPGDDGWRGFGSIQTPITNRTPHRPLPSSLGLSQGSSDQIATSVKRI